MDAAAERVLKVSVGRREQRGDRLDERLGVVGFLGEGNRRRHLREVIRQIPARLGGIAPARVDVELVVLLAGDVRPAVVAAALDDVDLVVGVRTVLGTVQCAVGSEADALSVAVSVAVNVADDAREFRVVRRDGAVQVQP